MGKKKYKDIKIGDTYNHLTVKSFDCMKGDHKPYWWCECDCEEHTVISVYDHDLKIGKKFSCGCVTKMTKEERRFSHIKKSFYDFCIEYNRRDVLDLWDYDLNSVGPEMVGFRSTIKYYFKCSKGIHSSTQKTISDIVQSIENNWKFEICKQCNSFAQYAIDKFGKDVLDKYWDYDKNTVDPWELTHSSPQMIYIKCVETDYHGSYLTHTYKFLNGDRCPYCAGKQVHYMDSLGYKYPQVIKLWSDKNTKSPFEYLPKSASCVWFKCVNEEHEDFCRKIYSVTNSGFACPECAKDKHISKLQKKVNAYLNENYSFEIRHECNCTILPHSPTTNRPMPFDNEIVDLKLVIEVHGLQHYEITSWAKHAALKHNISPEEEIKNMQNRDEYKMQYAIEHGYNYLIIPYWSEKDESYKKLIDDKIMEIMQYPIAV